jgi:hypothetical protein
MALIVRCKKHKKYLAKREPRTDCFGCHLLYIMHSRGKRRPGPGQYRFITNPVAKAFEQGTDELEIYLCEKNATKFG